jgi:hypothetical protein
MKMYQNRLSEGGNSICCYPKISQIKKYIKSALHIRSLSQSETKNPISTETVYDETNNWLFVIQLKYNQWGTFVVDAERVHGDLYDYSKSVYQGNKTPVVIICKTHGEFKQSPNNHIGSKQGCPSCYGNKKRDTESYIKQAQAVHGTLYDYSKCVYVNASTKVSVGCYKHGYFEQHAGSHLAGHGCPKCRSSFGEAKIRNLLKIWNIAFTEQKTFDGCRGCRRVLPFDFYLPEYDILIEYDGEQHFKPKFGNDNFEKTKETDNIKTCFCADNKLYLIRIRYDDSKFETTLKEGIENGKVFCYKQRRSSV